MKKKMKLVDDKSKNGRFIDEREMDSIRKIKSIGNRNKGRYENEVLDIKLFKEEIRRIVEKEKKINEIKMEIKKKSGEFKINLMDGMKNVYREVKNVIVRVSEMNDKYEKSIMVKWNFDKVKGRKGGSDDGESCEVMMEIIKIVKKMDKKIKKKLIMILNGEEENLMKE